MTVAESRGFVPGTLQVNGRIYAMVSRGRLIVKLPRARAGTLIASATGLPFDAGKGRPMMEWVAIRALRSDPPALARRPGRITDLGASAGPSTDQSLVYN